MDSKYLNISNIEDFLYKQMSKVTKNTFVGTLPEVVDNDIKEMLLIDCGNKVTDLDAFGGGIIHIWLYVRPIKNRRNTKNVALMAKLENALNSVIANCCDEHYMISRRFTYSDYDKERKWHCNIVEINLTIL